MKVCKINTLTTYFILLLATGLLACKPIVEPKDHPKKSKEVTTEPAPAPAPSAPPASSAPAEPVSKIEDVQSIQSLESNVASYDTNKDTEASAQYIEPSVAAKEAQVQVADDGSDVVKATPAIMRKVQQALVDAGFNPGPVDGVSGAKTVAAIESFQKRNGIPPGKLTKKTLRALGVDY